MANDGSFACATCGQNHDGLAYGFGVAAPLPFEQLSWLQRRGAKLGDETCVIKGERFFVRGLLEIPVKRRKTPFVWNVWSSVGPEDFGTILEHWISTDRVKDPPYAGALANDLSTVYPSTLNLKLAMKSRPVGQRPSFELDPGDHPLIAEQRGGITVDRVREINSILRHNGAAGSRL
jgi:hypothetical protein